jgi:exosortase K
MKSKNRWAPPFRWRPSEKTPIHFVLQTAFFYSIALLLAYGLKAHYSHATSDNLDWILWPTARLVSWLSGLEFIREAGTGYVNYDYAIIIAPACAGVNFLIAAWCMAIFSFLHRFKRVLRQFFWFSGCAVGTYVLTMVTNAFRILGAIGLYHWQTQLGWLTPNRLHRLEGIIVYFGALCVYFWLLRRFCKSSKEPFIHTLLPAFWYLAIILIIPFMRLTYQHDLACFVEHSGFVLGGCAVVLILIAFIHKLQRHLA